MQAERRGRQGKEKKQKQKQPAAGGQDDGDEAMDVEEGAEGGKKGGKKGLAGRVQKRKKKGYLSGALKCGTRVASDMWHGSARRAHVLLGLLPLQQGFKNHFHKKAKKGRK